MKKIFLTVILLGATAVILSGCETVKHTATGFSEGLHEDTVNTVANTKKVAVGTHVSLKKTDGWMRENMW